MKFYIIDAFTGELFGGNPAGIVLLENGSDFPNEKIMIKTAAELRYSETAFVKRIGEKEFNIRYFTPEAEVDLCGHATIASFYALLHAGIVKHSETYINNTVAGKLNIEISRESVFMDMGDPKEIAFIHSGEDLKELYSIMGLSYVGQDIYLKNPSIKLIPKIISTGLPDIMMPVMNEVLLEEIDPDFPELSKLSEKYSVVGVHAFTVNSSDGNIHCRNFAPLYAINEEAATGTSNGALSYYLYKYNILGEGNENIFIQGEKMNRPSKIMSRVILNGGEVKIQVGGSAVILAVGELKI